MAKHRTQVILEDWQYEKLVDAGRRQGRSMGEMVREAVTRYFAEPAEARDAILDVVALGSADGAPAAREHDRYLYFGHADRAANGTKEAREKDLRRHQRLVRPGRPK